VESLIIFLLIVALIYVLWLYWQLKGRIRGEREHIREDAIKQSEVVIRAKVTEHLMPYFPDFRYNPKDVRFIGSPIDLIVFDGLAEGNLKKVAFIEVKTGKDPDLSVREKHVKQCIDSRAVTFEIIHKPGGDE
jgi:predicted Holliday junction resolvase-like endonuclease